MDSIPITIDDRPFAALPGMTILEAAAAAGVDIPHLCKDPRVEPIGACRMCVVKIEGRPGLVTACSTPVAAGMRIRSENEELGAVRRGIMELVLAEHCVTCPTCDRDGACRLQDYAYRYRVDLARFGTAAPRAGRPNFSGGNFGILHDDAKCIRCGLCVKYCQEVQMAGALTFAGRGGAMEVSTAYGRELHRGDCELCGGCIRVCPAGAMLDRKAIGRGRERELGRTRTTCTYCGVGCTLDLLVDRAAGRIARATAEPGSPINDGNLCVKGHFGFEFVGSPDRLTHPLIKRGGHFEPATWADALTLVGRRFRQIRDEHGPDSVAFLSSSRCTNEENYLMQKLARIAGGTNNVDQCATTCHAATVEGLAAAFGSGAMTNSVAEIRDCQVMFVIGANPTEAHPIIGLEMKRALRCGATLIVCDPRRTWLARHAHLHLQLRPGSDNMLLNALMHQILAEGLEDRRFIEERCEGFAALRANLEHYGVERAAQYCGVPAELIRRAARLYAEGRPSAIFYTLGITEHSCGTDNVKNIANLAMLCGQIGKWASGVNPLRGQNNVQGACDMGALPHRLPGYQNPSDAAIRAKFETAWGAPLPGHRGGRVTDFIERAGTGVLKAFYVMGEDPVASEPNQSKVIRHLERLELLVCQEIFMTDTARLAQVILPGACWGEKEGTITASERRVQRVRKAVEPPGEAQPDWEILCQVSAAMGHALDYGGPEEVFNEMAALTPIYGGMSYGRLERAGLQWPCPTAGHPGTRFLHEGKFTRGRGLFQPIAFQPQKELPDEEYPFILSTGRTLYNYNTGNMTQRSEVIRQKESSNFVEIHHETAKRLGIGDGDMVRIRTRRGALRVRAVVGERVRPDTLWMPFHFVDQPTNQLTNDVFDPVAGTAEYKCCAARLERS